MSDIGFGCRVKYGSDSGMTGSKESLDLSIDRTGRSDVSIGNSSCALVKKKILVPEPVSEWPMPESASQSNYSEGSNVDDDSSQEDGGLLACLCYGFVVLGDMLCNIYSENDKSNVVYISRAPIIFGAKLQSASRLLTAEMAHDLYPMIPETSRLSTPTVAFATYRDGWSMTNLLAKTKDLDPVIILIRTLKHKVVIGAFSTAKLSPPSTRVRGNGECFVFRLSSPSSAYRWTYIPSVNKSSQNQFVVSCMDYIAFGGSAAEGTNALRLDGDLRTCDSGCSDTYQSEPLAPEEMIAEDVLGPFQVGDIEVLHVADSRRRSKPPYPR